MHRVSDGHLVDSGTYTIKGFHATLKGSGGQYQLTPQCLVWPHKGNHPSNQIVLEVTMTGGRFSGTVLLEGPLAMLYRLSDDLDQLIDGTRDQLKFPSELAIQELMLSTLLYIGLNPESETGLTMRCEGATPFLPSRNAPHMREQLQAERCVTALSVTSSIDLDSLESFRADLTRFRQWLDGDLSRTDLPGTDSDRN